MPVTTIAEFIELVRASGLPTAEAIAELAATSSATTPAELAPALIERELLTPWQSRMLLAGRRNIFLAKYELRNELGRGGMGAVFEARQGALGRVVALKVMNSALLKDVAAVARFHREIRSAAALDHPHVVRAFDAGSENGTHFLVMEYVAGRDLNSYARKFGSLPIDWSCECIRQAALGLQHAFERGLVHRDIKPANLLVARDSDTGWPIVKILDMGLARFSAESQADAALTHTGVVLGTPDYIAPEQATDIRQADIRSDIFSLGCTLFRLLTGQTPYAGNSVMEKLMARTLKSARRAQSLRAEIPRELDEAIARMLARDPAARFQTPAEVAAVLARFVANALVTPDGGVVARVAPAPSAMAATLSAPLAKAIAAPPEALISPSPQAIPADGQHVHNIDTERLSHKAPAELTFMLRNLAEVAAPATRPERRSDRPRRRFTLAIGLAALLAAGGFGVWAYQRSQRATLILDWPVDESADAALELDGRKQLLPAQGDLTIFGRGGAWRLRFTRTGYVTQEQTITIAAGRTANLKVRWQPTAGLVRKRAWQELKLAADVALKTLSSGSVQARADKAVLDVRDRLLDFRVQAAGSQESIAAARLLAKLPSPLDDLRASDIPVAERYSWQPRELVAALGRQECWHPRPGPQNLTYSPDGKMLVSTGGDGFLRIWDADTMHLQATIGNQGGRVFFTPDSRTLISVSGGEIRTFELSGADVVRSQVFEVDWYAQWSAISPDGNLLAVSDARNQLHLLDMKDRIPRLLVSFEPHRGTIRPEGNSAPLFGMAFTPDSRLLVTYSLIGEVQVWELQGTNLPRLRDTLLDRDWILQAHLAVSPDGTTLAVGTYGGMRIWDLLRTGSQSPQRLDGSAHMRPLVFSPDGRWLATGHQWGAIHLFDWQAPQHPLVATLSAHETWLWSLAFSPDSKTLASCGVEQTIRTWTVAGPDTHERVFPHTGREIGIWGQRFDARGRWLMTWGGSGQITFWDTTTGREIRRLGDRNNQNAISRLDLTTDQSQIAVYRPNLQQLTIVDASSGDVQATAVLTFGWRLEELKFRPDGKVLAVQATSGDWQIYRVAAPGGDLKLLEERKGVAAFDWSPDGRWLALAESRNDHEKECQLHVLDAKTMQPAYSLGDLNRPPRFLRFSPDCLSLAATFDHTESQPDSIMLYNLKERRESKSLVLRAALDSLEFSSDGSQLLYGDAGGVVAILDARTMLIDQTWELPAWSAANVRASFSPDGQYVAVTSLFPVVYVLKAPRDELAP